MASGDGQQGDVAANGLAADGAVGDGQAGDGPAGDDPRGNSPSLGLDLATATRMVEFAEAQRMWALLAGAPEQVRAALGLSATVIDGGVILATRDDPTGGHWSTAVGVGLDRAIDGDTVAQIIDAARTAGASRIGIRIAPIALPADWPAIVARYRLTAGATVVKLLRDTGGGTPAAGGGLDLARTDARGGDAWAATMVEGFGWPMRADVVGVLAGVVSRGFVAYTAWDADRIVGGASVFVGAPVAALSGTAIIPDQRGKGGHAALIDARVAAARDAGCTWVSGEADPVGEGRGSAPLRHMLAAGFVPVYERVTWEWSVGH